MLTCAVLPVKSLQALLFFFIISAHIQFAIECKHPIDVKKEIHIIVCLLSAFRLFSCYVRNEDLYIEE